MEKYCPFRTKIYDLKPKATMEGFIAGVLTALIVNFTIGTALLKSEWARAQPTAFTLIPFDRSCYTIAETEIFATNEQAISLGPLGDFTLSYSKIQIYLFVLTLFIAFISPFGGFAIAGMKRALRSREKSSSKHGKAIDRLDCILLVGFFMCLFIHKVVYQEKSVTQVVQMVQELSPKAQALLRAKLEAGK
jgi:CDP-diglyceride synthetase